MRKFTKSSKIRPSSTPLKALVTRTRYSKRYLTTLATSYWFGINKILFSHKHAAVFSSPEVQHNKMKAMTQPPLIMICKDRGSICSEWTVLWYETLVRSLCTEPELCEFIILKYLLLIDFITFVNETQVGTDLRGDNCMLLAHRP